MIDISEECIIFTVLNGNIAKRKPSQNTGIGIVNYSLIIDLGSVTPNFVQPIDAILGMSVLIKTDM